MAQETKKTTKRTASKTPAATGTGAVLSMADLGIKAPTPLSARTYATWVRTLLQNWRQGTVKVKTRSEVAKSRKKPWKQKGTGRARVGSARSPLWRGGGIIFGPQARTRTLKLPVAAKRRVLRALFAQLAQSGRIHVLDVALSATKPSTAAMHKAFNEAGLLRRVTVLLTPDDVLTQASCSNIPFAQVLLFDQLNAFDLSNTEHVVVLKKDVEHLKKMVMQWN